MSKTPSNGSFLNRRQMLRILAVGGAAGAVWGVGALTRRSAVPVSRTRILMGTVVNLTVVGDDRDETEAAVDSTLARMAELETLLSRYIPESEVSRLNAAGSLDDASAELLELLELARRISAMGDGAFDITVQPLLDRYRQHLAEHHELPPREAVEQALEQVGFGALRVEGRRIAFDRPGMGITPDGIGKGYVIDRGVAELERRGFANVLVEAGGDLVASGRKDADTPWRVGIRSPRPGLQLQARFDAENQAVTTSGDYMQPFTPDFSQHHILDPRTGYSAPELASSTVVAPTAALADGLSTLTMVLGPRKSVELIESLANCEGYFVSKELEVTQTSGFHAIG